MTFRFAFKAELRIETNEIRNFLILVLLLLG